MYFPSRLVLPFIYILLMSSPQQTEGSTQACSGACNCSHQTPEALTAWCRLRNISDLRRFIHRPQDITVMYLQLNSTKAWSSDFTAQLSSLASLHFVGGHNWSLQEQLLSLPKLREITGVDLCNECTNCSLFKNYEVDNYRSIRYIPEGYVIRSSSCSEQTLILKIGDFGFPRNGFFPACIVNDKICHGCVIGHQEDRNLCLDLGAPVLIAVFPTGAVAVTLSLTVLILTVTTSELRKKPSMILVASLASSDLILCVFGIYMATLYQILDKDNFAAYLEDVCPYLGFLLIVGFSSTTHVSFLITIERFLVIVFPLKRHLHMCSKSCLMWVMFFAVLSLALGIWTFFIPDLYFGSEMCIPVSTLQLDHSFGFTTTAFGTGFFLYVATVVLYCKIFIATRKSSRNAGSVNKDTKLVRSIGLVIVTNMFLSFLPAFVIVPVRSLVRKMNYAEDNWMIWGLYFPIIMAGINTMVNPLLYAFRNRSFQKVLKQKLNLRRPNVKQRKISSRKPKAPAPTGQAVVLMNFRQLK